MTPAAWRESGRSLDRRGGRIFFRDAGGTGTPLLCLHGFPTSSWDFHRVWDALADRYRVVAHDMIGYGFSSKPRDYAYSIADQADIVEGLTASLGIEEAHVLAHDVGDTVVQELLARRLSDPARAPKLRSVCLLNGGLFPEQHRPQPLQTALLGENGEAIAAGVTRELFAGFGAVFGPSTQPSDEELDGYWACISHEEGAKLWHVSIRYMLERRDHRERWVGALQKTSVPLRLVNGPEDPVSGRHAAERYCELIPDPDVVLLEGIGHYPQMEAPQSVVEHLLAFHARVEA